MKTNRPRHSICSSRRAALVSPLTAAQRGRQLPAAPRCAEELAQPRRPDHPAPRWPGSRTRAARAGCRPVRRTDGCRGSTRGSGPRASPGCAPAVDASARRSTRARARSRSRTSSAEKVKSSCRNSARSPRAQRWIGDAVRVVKHDEAARHVSGGQRVRQFRHQRLPRGALAVLRGDQRFGRGAPRKVEGSSAATRQAARRPRSSSSSAAIHASAVPGVGRRAAFSRAAASTR